MPNQNSQAKDRIEIDIEIETEIDGKRDGTRVVSSLITWVFYHLAPPTRETISRDEPRTFFMTFSPHGWDKAQGPSPRTSSELQGCGKPYARSMQF